MSPRALQFLGPVCALKTEGENHLKASGLAYTIVRPGGLGHGPASGRGHLREEPMTSGGIASAELARLTEAGLVTASPGRHDRRRSELALTPLGQQACQRVRDEMARIVRRNLADYSVDEVMLFARMLRDVRQLEEDEVPVVC